VGGLNLTGCSKLLEGERLSGGRSSRSRVVCVIRGIHNAVNSAGSTKGGKDREREVCVNILEEGRLWPVGFDVQRSRRRSGGNFKLEEGGRS